MRLAFYSGLWPSILELQKFVIFWAGCGAWFQFLEPYQVYERKREEVRCSVAQTSISLLFVKKTVMDQAAEEKMKKEECFKKKRE